MVEQVCELHVAGWHWLPLGGQSFADKHWTHIPVPSQTVPPPWLHAVPAPAFTVPHVPLVHTAVLQADPDGGQFAAVTHCTQVPLPSQTVPPPWLHEVPMGLNWVVHM